MCGWVAGSNGNKANLSPAEAGAGLSLAIIGVEKKGQLLPAQTLPGLDAELYRVVSSIRALQ